ncbi:MAG: hypothetical protein CME62_00660 [Halobacteriovoraceae bacterium]|nr:hypothetical protein [Halobacteriovoraceae bacterium]|tara:strand:+ start:29508 stop:30167 length:660 start_codon:yes stop_codon:yes gene_type:complete
MAMKTVAFIDNFINEPINHCVNEIILRNNLVATYHQPARFGMASLYDLPKVEKVIVLGSASHVTDNEPWHKELLQFLLPHIQNNTPTLGICFGHQLFVHHYGGDIDYINQSQENFELVRDVHFQQKIWGHDFGSHFPMPYAHQQVVKKIPKEFEIIAHTDQSPFEVLKHKRHQLWTIQGHPESSLKYIENKLNISDKQLALKIKSSGNKLIDQFIRFDS